MSKEDYFESGKYERSPKLFITNLPPNIPDEDLKNDIEPLFTPYGKINSINVKKHKSGQYSYAFLQFEKIEDAIRAIEQMDQKPVHQRPMKVRQDRQSEGCFNCKKTGHFAKQCPNNPNKQERLGGRRERSRDKYERGGGRYDAGEKYYRRDNRQRGQRRDNRQRSDSYDRYDRRRKDRSPREYSPYDERRRRGDRQGGRRPSGRSPRSRSRSYSDSYDRSRYRRDYYDRDDRRDSRRGQDRRGDRREQRRDDRRDDRRDRDRENRDGDNRKYRQASRSESYEHGSH